MSKASKVFVWSDADLDGAGSVLMLSWVFGVQLPFRITTTKKFREDFTSWYSANKDNYDNIFVCDMDVSSCIDIVDDKRIIIIDHHESHVLNSAKYSKATKLVKKHSSCVQLIYDTYKNKLDHLTKEQKLLIMLINDYDSYKFKFPFTKDLNTVYWQFTGNRAQKFFDDFKDGFSGFSRFHKNSIGLYNKKMADIIANLDIYAGNVSIGDSTYRVVSTAADAGINDVAEYIIKHCEADIAIIVNLKSNTVSFRRSSECTLPMHKLAMKLAHGGGHEESAGGSITEQFLNFTKILHRI